MLGSVTETKEGAVDVGNSAIHEGAKRVKEGPKVSPARIGLVLVGLQGTRTSHCEMGALGPAPAGVPPTVNDTSRATRETSRRHRLMSGGRTSMECGEG